MKTREISDSIWTSHLDFFGHQGVHLVWLLCNFQAQPVKPAQFPGPSGYMKISV